MITIKDQPQHRLASNVIVFVAFLLTAQLGTYFYREVGTSPAMIWAPIGIAFAAVILGGVSLWPSIALATIVNGMLNGTPPLIIAGATLGNTLQPLVAYYFLKRAGLNRKLASVKDMFLILGTSLFITMIVPTFNTLTINLYNYLYGGDRSTFWTSWWIGGALSALILTPFLIRWLRYPLSRRGKFRTVEIVVALLALCVISYFLFATTHVMIGSLSLIYPLLAVLLWLAFRTDSRVMTLALFLMTLISLLGALYGNYNPTAGGLSGRVFNTQVFDLFLAFIFFVLVSLEEQRKQAVAIMKDRNSQLENAMERIRQNDTTKNEFIATLAHELRNPLAAFLSSVELLLLQESPDPAEVKRLAEMMQGRVQTMGRLLDDLLDISRVSRGEMDLKKERVNLREVVRKAIEALEPMIKEHHHTFSASLPLEEIFLHADPVRLEQILVNLLTNAVKYTPPGGRIELNGKYQDDWLYLSVTDNGIGIPSHMLTRIFDSFVQVKTGSRAVSGMGIGLALTKGLVEMHGGTIVAKSEGKGSEFIVKLPATRATPENREGGSGSAGLERSVESGKFHILVVDDNIEAALGLGKLLTLRGHSADVAHDGQSALEQISKKRPDVVLLDIGLPDMDGYDVARKLKEHDDTPFLIALTGYGQIEDRERASQAGFDHHLTKPVGLADIEEVLRELGSGL